MAEIEADTLFPNNRTITAVAEGEMTQIHRGKPYAEEGDTFDIEGETFAVVEVTERTLGEMTDEDAQREGSPSLAAYKERMVAAHGGNFEWDETATVYRHRVAKQE